MQIIKRDNYKIKPDELMFVALDEEFAKLACSILNKNREDNDKYYYQVVSDEFKVD